MMVTSCMVRLLRKGEVDSMGPRIAVTWSTPEAQPPTKRPKKGSECGVFCSTSDMFLMMLKPRRTSKLFIITTPISTPVSTVPSARTGCTANTVLPKPLSWSTLDEKNVVSADPCSAVSLPEIRSRFVLCTCLSNVAGNCNVLDIFRRIVRPIAVTRGVPEICHSLALPFSTSAVAAVKSSVLVTCSSASSVRWVGLSAPVWTSGNRHQPKTFPPDPMLALKF
mmetsp:Transcript_94206/g.266483  ORF Transcript_94206/g.266483 Transcript_94206/m.266483 type:complete len:223 (-) Transcript_94206:37-705(-)